MQRTPSLRRPVAAGVITLALAMIVAASAAVAARTHAPAATTSSTNTASGATGRTPAHGRATVRVGGPAAVAAAPTTQGFLGLATSFSTLPVLSGSPTDPDTAFLNLLRGLSPDAPFLLRLGGVSADNSWWPIPGMKEPYLRVLTPQIAKDIHALLSALGGKAILGLNLEEGPRIDSRMVQAEVAGFERYIGASQIEALELGNEPEYWPLSVMNGGRGHDTIAAYAKRFSQIASGLTGDPIAGPASVGPVWLDRLGTILGRLPSRLKLVTVHLYPLKNCSAHAHPLLSQLLSPSSIQGLAASAHGMVKAAAAHRKPLIVDELNAITCGGKAGVSNSFGEALWALNALPALWRAGVKGVTFQTVDGLLNQVISARHSASGWRVAVQPVYYGLLAFADAVPAGSHLLRISNPGLVHFYQFAVRAPDGSERVVLTNVGSVPRTIGVHASGAHGTGSLSLLRARSLSATGGTTLAGEHLSARTGQLTGTPRVTSLRPNARGVYAVRVPAHAAAILTLSHG